MQVVQFMFFVLLLVPVGADHDQTTEGFQYGGVTYANKFCAFLCWYLPQYCFSPCVVSAPTPSPLPSPSPSTAPAPADTTICFNTGLKISLALQSCALGPSQECCDALSTFESSNCFCNPLILDLFGLTQSVAGFAQLGSLCPSPVTLTVSQQACALPNGICGIPQWQIDAARIQAADIVLSLPIDMSPINITRLRELNAPFITPETTLTLPATGQYQGLEDITEYTALANVETTEGLAKITNRIPLFLASSTTTGFLTGNNSLLFNLYYDQPWNDPASQPAFSVQGYGAYNVTFISPCSPVIRSIELAYPQPVYEFTGRGAGNYRGILHLCQTIQSSCTGPQQQYESVQECISYMNSIPEVSPMCEANGKFYQGTSVACRFLHSFLASQNDFHCAHVGKAGTPDPDGKFRCSDVHQCV